MEKVRIRKIIEDIIMVIIYNFTLLLKNNH